MALIAVWRSEQEDFKSQTRAWLDQATRASRWRPIIVSVGWAAGHDLTKADVEQAGPAFTRALRAHATSGFRLKQEQFGPHRCAPINGSANISLSDEGALALCLVGGSPEHRKDARTRCGLATCGRLSDSRFKVGPDPQNRRVLLARATALLLDAFDADFGTQWSEGDAAKCLRQACSKCARYDHGLQHCGS